MQVKSSTIAMVTFMLDLNLRPITLNGISCAKAPFLNSKRPSPFDTVPSAKITTLFNLSPYFIFSILFYNFDITSNLESLFDLSTKIVCIIPAIVPTIGKFWTEDFAIKHLLPYVKKYIGSKKVIWLLTISWQSYKCPFGTKFGCLRASKGIFFTVIQYIPITNIISLQYILTIKEE